MYRPQNSFLVIPKVLKKIDGTYTTLIRRLTFVDYTVVSKDVLSENGEWVNILEGAEYPVECWLASPVVDEKEEIEKEKEWQNWQTTKKEWLKTGTPTPIEEA